MGGLNLECIIATQVNSVGTYKVVASAVRVMKDNVPDEDGGRGVIINLASVTGTDGRGMYAPYSATKGAVAAMTLPLARDLARYGIRVNSIAPGKHPITFVTLGADTIYTFVPKYLTKRFISPTLLSKLLILKEPHPLEWSPLRRRGPRTHPWR